MLIKNLKILKTAKKLLSVLTIFFVFHLLVSLYFVPSTQAKVPLDSFQNPPECSSPYSNDMVGNYGIAIGGVGLQEDGPNYNKSFQVNSIDGNVVEAYLYWSIRYSGSDPKIKLKINSGTIKEHTAQPAARFEHAVLSGPSTTYAGYIVRLVGADLSSISSPSSTFTVSKTAPATDFDLYGAGILIIYQNSSLPQRHVEVKCGFDVTYANDIGNDPSDAKWGMWSDVICHQFPPDTGHNRNIHYYAFMSGTKKTETGVYRPNAFWYVTGAGSIPPSITSLNKPGNTPNQGLVGVPGRVEKTDFFNANSGNEWDTIEFDAINIPVNHEYICFQTQSRNSPGWTSGNYGKGTSMQWSMSALTFAYAGAVNTPTPSQSPTITPTSTPGPSPTPTIIPSITPSPTPTPIIYDPWVNTMGGNTYSQTFNQTRLMNPNIQHSYQNSSQPIHFNGSPVYLSTNLYLQPIGFGLPPRSSEKRSELANYNDANSEYKPSVSWFSYFKQYLLNSSLPNVSIIPRTDTSITLPTTSSLTVTDPARVYIFHFPNSVAIDIDRCNSKSIFLIEGNLTLNPNFTVDGNENGCLFIVSGTTTIQKGDDLGSEDATPKTVFDQIHGYFVTGLFNTEPDNTSRDGLFIKGGVVETDMNSGQMNLSRDLGSTRNLYTPSEIIEYDARYLYIYGDLLTYSYGYNIRESQFIRTI